MAVKKGTLSIDSENIFPIIKKWVYSDHDIFVRELVSNGCDAITKLKKLDMMGEYELPEGYKPKIEVIVNPEEKTMKLKIWQKKAPMMPAVFRYWKVWRLSGSVLGCILAAFPERV